MKRCVGQGISLHGMSLCVVDDAGAVVAQASTLPDPGAAVGASRWDAALTGPEAASDPITARHGQRRERHWLSI